jgi:hypothetical protein
VLLAVLNLKAQGNGLIAVSRAGIRRTTYGKKCSMFAYSVAKSLYHRMMKLSFVAERAGKSTNAENRQM